MSVELHRPLQISSTDIDSSKFPFEALVAMREAFPTQNDDILARFLLARNGNVEKASTLLSGHLEWRATSWPILKSSCINEIVKGKLYMHGTDLEGHPLLIWRVRFNFAKDRDLDEMGRMVIWWMETAIASVKDKSKVTVLLDRTGFKSENSDIEFCQHLTPIFQNHFPERLYRAVVYPSGLVFYGIWNIVKWFLDPVTQEKVQPVLALSGVQQYIDNKYIPVDMGGECTYEFNPNEFPDPYPADVLAALNGDDSPSGAASTTATSDA